MSREERVPHTLCLIVQEVLDLARRAVVRDNGEALVIHIQNEVLALYMRVSDVMVVPDVQLPYHDGQTDEADITTERRRCI